MTDEAERLQILEMIEKGVISAAEGVRLLNSLQGELPDSTAQSEVDSSPNVASSAPMPEVIEEKSFATPAPSSAKFNYDSSIKKWRSFWWIPLTVGLVITVVSAALMYLAVLKSGLGFWFACLWFPLLFGLIIIILAVASRTTRWLHVRVHQEPGEWPQTIAISMPLPIRFAAWFLRTFQVHIPGMDKTSLDEVILALEKTSPDQPFYVKVDEDDSGEKVEVYIG